MRRPPIAAVVHRRTGGADQENSSRRSLTLARGAGVITEWPYTRYNCYFRVSATIRSASPSPSPPESASRCVAPRCRVALELRSCSKSPPARTSVDQRHGQKYGCRCDTPGVSSCRGCRDGAPQLACHVGKYLPPVPRGALAEKSRRRVPWRVPALQQPTPVGRMLERHPMSGAPALPRGAPPQCRRLRRGLDPS